MFKFLNEKEGQPRAGFLAPKAVGAAGATRAGKGGKEKRAVGAAAVSGEGVTKETPVVGENAKVQALLAGLDKVGQQGGVATRDLEQNSDAMTAPELTGAATIADDVALPAEVAAQIAADEVLVREALALFGIDYGALIAMDETSGYGRAVRGNPGLLQQIAASERPVLAALKVAVEFKPYAEFLAQYGDNPAAIKAAIKAEMEAEKTAKRKGVAAADADAAGDASGVAAVLPFSYGGRTAKDSGQEKVKTLADVFPS